MKGNQIVEYKIHCLHFRRGACEIINWEKEFADLLSFCNSDIKKPSKEWKKRIQVFNSIWASTHCNAQSDSDPCTDGE